MKKTAIAAALPLWLLLGGCVASRPDPGPSPAQNELAIQSERIVELAVAAGIPEERAKRTPPLELLRDLEALFRDAETYSAAELSAEDLKLLDSYLNDQPQILKTVRIHDRLVRRIRNRRIVILPEEKEAL